MKTPAHSLTTTRPLTATPSPSHFCISLLAAQAIHHNSAVHPPHTCCTSSAQRPLAPRSQPPICPSAAATPRLHWPIPPHPWPSGCLSKCPPPPCTAAAAAWPPRAAVAAASTPACACSAQPPPAAARCHGAAVTTATSTSSSSSPSCTPRYSSPAPQQQQEQHHRAATQTNQAAAARRFASSTSTSPASRAGCRRAAGRAGLRRT
jgi:hypothetical protein